MTTISIRPFRPDDAAAVHDLFIRANRLLCLTSRLRRRAFGQCSYSKIVN
jgi:hypothetical protein